jgi:hypothetical protein
MKSASEIEKARNIITNEVNQYLDIGATKISTYQAMARKYKINSRGVANFVEKQVTGFRVLQKYAQKILEHKE